MVVTVTVNGPKVHMTFWKIARAHNITDHFHKGSRTQQELCGKTLPDWDQAMAMCLSAATCFPGLRLQHWDVTFCREGPVLMEE